MHATYIDRVASVAFVTLKNKEGQADMGDVGCREQSSIHRNMTEEAEVGPGSFSDSLVHMAACCSLVKGQRGEDRRTKSVSLVKGGAPQIHINNTFELESNTTSLREGLLSTC